MVTRKSAQRETKDLRRLLLAVGLLRSKQIANWKAGVWGDEGQRVMTTRTAKPRFGGR